MKNSREEQILRHDEISNFTEDIPMNHSLESAMLEIDNIMNEIKDSIHFENEIEKSIQNIHEVPVIEKSPIADCQLIAAEKRAVNHASTISMNQENFAPKVDPEISNGKILSCKKILQKISKSIVGELSKQFSKIENSVKYSIEKFQNNFYLSKIPFGIIAIVLMLFITFKLQKNSRILEGDLLNRFKLDSLNVNSVFDSRFLSYSMVHMNLEHLIPNLLFLSLFGSIVEIKLGTLNLLFAYFSMCYLVGLGWYYRQLTLISQYSANQSLVGASGAIYGLMTIALLICLFDAYPILISSIGSKVSGSKPVKYRFWNLFGSSIAIFAICSLYLSETVLFPSVQTATDAHIIGSIIGIPVFILILLKNRIFEYFCNKNCSRLEPSVCIV